jgi:hypothetical protein
MKVSHRIVVIRRQVKRLVAAAEKRRPVIRLAFLSVTGAVAIRTSALSDPGAQQWRG